MTSTTTAPDAGDTNRWYLSSAPIVRALIHLCAPMAAALIISAVYNVVNAGFIGSLHNATLLAAVTFASPILGLVMGVGGVFGTGGSTLVSRLLGASETESTHQDQIKHVAAFALWGAVITGVVLAVIGLVFLHPLVVALGANPAAVPATSAFVAVTLAFVPILAAAFCLEQLVRAQGASREVMIGLIVSTVANLIFDVLFILILGWGVAGAALAVGLANLISAGYFVTWLTRHGEQVSLAPKWFTLSPAIVKPILGVGVGELLQAGFLIVTSLVLNNLAAHYGDGPLAAMGVAVRIAQVPEFLIMGVTLGVLPLLAYAFGKGDRDRLTSSLRGAAITVGGIAVIFSGVVFLFRAQLFSLFVADPRLLGLGATIMTAQLVSMIFNGFTGLITSLFQATGKALPATIMSTIQGVLFIPIVILANLWFGLNGIIWALTASEGLVLVAGLLLLLALRTRIEGDLTEGSVDRAELVLQEG